MQKEELRKLIFTASGKDQADTVIKNAKIVDVYSGEIIEGEDIAIVDGDRKSTRLNSSHIEESRMPSSA